MTDILKQLEQVIMERKYAAPESSYVASLFAKGQDKILQKISEEATEVLLAAKDKDKGQVVYEMADLWFHNLVLLVEQGVSSEDVLAELERRFGLSGLEEKAQREK